MGKITLHVLDTTNGCPASGVKLDLYSVGDAGRLVLISNHITNKEGRLDEPLFKTLEPHPSKFRIVFHAADYFRQKGFKLPSPPFFEDIPIDFGIAEPDQHYHIPLLVSPYGYSTYRGS